MRSDRLSHEVRPGSFEEILLFIVFLSFFSPTLYFLLSTFYFLLSVFYTFYFVAQVGYLLQLAPISSLEALTGASSTCSW